MTTDLIPQKKIDYWIDNRLNVLLRGYHGVGKTAIVLSNWKRRRLKYLYFSASTLDPWVDLLGIPDVKGETLRFVQRADLETAQAIFFDEYNRAPLKVRNAVMELVQFKSINGKPLPNLKMVWCAINPDEVPKELHLDFDVEVLDPAQLDRFHVHYEVPVALDKEYLGRKFPKLKDKIENLNSWYNDLPLATRVRFSPRRIQYTLAMLISGGDIADSVPKPFTKAMFLAALKAPATTSSGPIPLTALTPVQRKGKKSLLDALGLIVSINPSLRGKDSFVLKKAYNLLDRVEEGMIKNFSAYVSREDLKIKKLTPSVCRARLRYIIRHPEEYPELKFTLEPLVNGLTDLIESGRTSTSKGRKKNDDDEDVERADEDESEKNGVYVVEASKRRGRPPGSVKMKDGS